MMEKIKNNLTYVACAGLGLLNFIFLAIPYIAFFQSIDLGQWGGVQSDSSGISGYKVMDLWDGGFSGVMSALIQVFILILGIALLAWGVMGLLKAFGIFEKFPDKIGKFESKKIGEYGLFGFGGLNVLLLIFLIIFTAVNSETFTGDYGVESAGGFKFSAGIFITLVFIIGFIVALKLLEKKFPANESGQTFTYTCAKCGKKAKATDRFCSACGGEIEKKLFVKKEYVCLKCGKKAKATDKFCSACGGEVILKDETTIENTATTIDDVIPKG